MGAADVVPGVSGGTIAFITDIYDELLDSIKRLGPGAVLAQDGIAACWKHINGAFLLTFGSGILLSLFSLARVISGLLVPHPIPLWSFFTGLMLGSVNKLWPWKQTTADQVFNVLPQTYEHLTGQTAQLTLALAMDGALCGGDGVGD
nr:DUF368 domain-containing protein [Endozoicomonas sp. ONNA2]